MEVWSIIYDRFGPTSRVGCSTWHESVERHWQKSKYMLRAAEHWWTYGPSASLPRATDDGLKHEGLFGDLNELKQAFEGARSNQPLNGAWGQWTWNALEECRIHHYFPYNTCNCSNCRAERDKS